MTRTIVYSIVFAFLLLSLIGSLHPRFAWAQSVQPSIDAIIQAWRQREEQTVSFDCTWVGNHFEIGSRLRVPISNANRKQAPPAEVLYNTRRRFVSDQNGQLRIEMDDKIWMEDTATLGPQSMMKIINSDARKVFFRCGRQAYPICYVGERAIPGGKDTRLTAIRLVYRPFDKEIGLFDANKITLTDKSALIGDNRLLVVDHGNGTVWVDPMHEFVPVRFNRTQPGMTQIVEISYRNDEQYHWVPTSWTNTCTNGKGDITVSDADTVQNLSINQTVSSADFALNLPTGTFVSDSIANESYIVLPAGERRLVLAGEFKGNNYEQLLHTTAGSQLLGFKWRLNWTLICINVFLMVTLLIACRSYWKGRKRIVQRSTV